jgi:hypothetical protein
VIDGGGWKQSGIIEFSTDKKFFCDLQTDTAAKTMRIRSQLDTTENYFLHYSLSHDGDIMLTGRWKGDTIEVLMNKYDLDNYLLHRERFKWITN